MIEKIEEQLGKAKFGENNPTLKFTNKIQKILCQLRGKKFTDKKYFWIYPSDPIQPWLPGMVKVHKPEKNYPMTTTVSAIPTPVYRISNNSTNSKQK